MTTTEEATEDEAVEYEEPTVWWHGGRRVEGDLILPPTPDDLEADLDVMLAVGMRDAPPPTDRVLITSRTAAVMMAALYDRPWIYEVEPVGELEFDPNLVGSPNPYAVVLAPQARIVRRYNPNGTEVRKWRRTLNRHLRAQMGQAKP